MFKQKYASVLAEYEKFWERKNTERPILNIAYTKTGAVPYRAPATLEEQWLDPEYNYAAFKRRDENSVYLAEGIPGYFTNFGPGCLSACLGGGFQLAKQTVWFDKPQIITDWENPPAVKFDEQSEMWQLVKKSHEEFSSDVETHFTIADLGGILDIVAALRGTEELLYDLYDYPDEVKEISAKVKRRGLRRLICRWML
jgi:5-methyltetrahydrofolate--homocysteine methyltransferase